MSRTPELNNAGVMNNMNFSFRDEKNWVAYSSPIGMYDDTAIQKSSPIASNKFIITFGRSNCKFTHRWSGISQHPF